MKTLNTIVEHKIVEVKERQELYPVQLLERSIYFRAQSVSLSKYLLREDKSGIIVALHC